MRGGPRMMCSPYLTGSLALMLVLVTFNYWSVSTHNFDLTKEVKRMQTQLEKATEAIKDKDKEIADLKEKLSDQVNEANALQKAVKGCNDKKETLETNKNTEKEELEKEIVRLKSEHDAFVQKADADKEEAEKAVNSLKEDLTTKTKELTELQAEIQSLKADQMANPKHVANVPPGLPSNYSNDAHGQLPDVDPNAVSVVRKETHGMRFHLDNSGRNYLPILPRGDPNKPRAHPLYSVADIAASKTIKRSVVTGSGLSLWPFQAAEAPNSKLNETADVKRPLVADKQEDVLPVPNLDKAEDDIRIPEHENGPDGKKEIADDDQNPDGRIEEVKQQEKPLNNDAENKEDGNVDEDKSAIDNHEDLDN